MSIKTKVVLTVVKIQVSDDTPDADCVKLEKELSTDYEESFDMGTCLMYDGLNGMLTDRCVGDYTIHAPNFQIWKGNRKVV